ncbi:MAG TPA: hypothetical protein VMV18_12645 [bacterium]|nr:hypothetical protein [bacterium]
MPRTPANEFYCIEMHNLEPGDLLNALKALLEGRLSRFVSVGKDSVGKAHAFRFSPDPRGKEPAPLEPGDEEVFLPMLASRFNKNCARVRYDADKQEGVVHRSNPKGELELIDYRMEPLPNWPGRLFERPLTWTEPAWLGTGTPPGRPERPQPNTPGYDLPLEKGSYIGAFAPFGGSAAEAAKTEVERGATGELTLRTADGMDGKVWFESGQAVGIVFDPIRGASAEKTWEAMQKETFKERRFRINVPRPDHIGFAKGLTNRLVPKK